MRKYKMYNLYEFGDIERRIQVVELVHGVFWSIGDSTSFRDFLNDDAGGWTQYQNDKLEYIGNIIVKEKADE